MPIVQVFCAAGAEVPQRLAATCATVAEALALPDEAVIATHVPTGVTVRPGHPPAEQVVVVVHSSARDRNAVEAARAAVQGLADSWTNGDPAWVSWQERP